MTGRPTKFDPATDYDAKAVEYLATCVDVETSRVRSYTKDGQGFQLGIKVSLPTKEGFAEHLGVVISTLDLWEKEHREFFSGALARIAYEQKKRLLNSGLSGDYNPVIAKLVLSSNHGMRERSDVTSEDRVLPTPIMANYALHLDDGHEEGNGDARTDKGGSGRDVGVEDDLDSLVPDPLGAV